MRRVLFFAFHQLDPMRSRLGLLARVAAGLGNRVRLLCLAPDASLEATHTPDLDVATLRNPMRGRTDVANDYFAWTPRIRDDFDGFIGCWSESVVAQMGDFLPDLIVTQGVLALDMVARRQLELEMAMPGGILPWVHDVDLDYKYGLAKQHPMRQLLAGKLYQRLHIPDQIWCAEPAHVHRVSKDAALPSRPILIPTPFPEPAPDSLAHGSEGMLAVILAEEDLARRLERWRISRLVRRLSRTGRRPVRLVRLHPAHAFHRSVWLPGNCEALQQDMSLWLSPYHPSSPDPCDQEAGDVLIVSRSISIDEGLRYVAHNRHPRVWFADACRKDSLLWQAFGRPLNELGRVHHGGFGERGWSAYSAKKAEVDAVATAAVDASLNILSPLDGGLSSGESRFRVFHGVTGSAGQPATVSRAMRRAGVHSDAVVIGENYYSYHTDRHFRNLSPEQAARMLVRFVRQYNVFHFYFRSIFFSKINLEFPTAMDMLFLRACGCTVIMNFRGSEVRLENEFRSMNPFHYVDERPSAVTNFPDWSQRRYLDFIRSVASRITVPDPELKSYVPEAIMIPRAVELTDCPYVGLTSQQQPLIVHAPTKRSIKGTDSIIAAIDRLRSERLGFRFELVENQAHQVAMQTYRRADIVIDQLRIGWYGVLSVEAMLLGKAVVAYIRPDLIDEFRSIVRDVLGTDELPIAMATPESITDVLRELVIDRGLREKLSARGRAFAERYHDADRVAAAYLELYENAGRAPNTVDLSGVARMIAWQTGVQENRAAPLRARVDELVAAIRGAAKT